MARPRKSESIIRKHKINVRLNDTELVVIFKKADLLELPPSTFLRKAGLKEKMVIPIPEINFKIYQELGRIGNNLNQFMRHFHRAGSSAFPSGTLEELSVFLRKIQMELLNR